MGVDPTSCVALSLMPCRGPAATRSVSTGAVATASTCTAPRLLPQLLGAGRESPLLILPCTGLYLGAVMPALPLQQHRGSLRILRGLVPASRTRSNSPVGSIEQHL